MMSITDVEKNIVEEYFNLYKSDLDEDCKFINSCYFIVKIVKQAKKQKDNEWGNILRNIFILYLNL